MNRKFGRFKLNRLCKSIWNHEDYDVLRKSVLFKVWDIDEIQTCSSPLLPGGFSAFDDLDNELNQFLVINSDSDNDSSDEDRPDSSSDGSKSSAGSDSDLNVDWVYRPLDISDIQGEGPFDVNYWHRL
jgi:hypothetical protein